MDLLVFDAKRNRNGSKVPVALNKEELSEMLGHRQINAFMIGGLVQIFDETISQILNECSGIGEWMDDGRKENHGVSRTCFSRKEEIDTENKKEIEEAEAAKWAELSPTINSLVLSPMETVLLSIDWKLMNVKKGENLLSDSEIWMKSKDSFDNPDKFGRSFAVFRYLKMNGWIVRSGMTFGCDFLIYCLGAQYYHSSAGVLISENIHPQHLLTLTRILAHNKKSLIVATASKDVETFEDLSNVEVKHVTMKTYFLERDVSQISHQRNELYELKPID